MESLRSSVYDVAQERLERLFTDFDNIFISFSGGKDSGVLLNLCIDYIRRNKLDRKVGVFHLDYEVQYQETIRYVDRVLASNTDILEVYRICVPFKVTTCASMFQDYWRPWEDSKQSLWVREKPAGSYSKEDFDFYTENLWDYEFQIRFAEWLHKRKKAIRTCCLIGIRSQESLNRWRTVHSDKNYRKYKGLKWIREMKYGICNAYPIHDWLTTDVWVANGRYGWDYNKLYDLYYQAGVPLERQRVASPFISPAISSLRLYKAIDPDMWGKMVSRINGVNFAGLYGNTSMMGWQSIKLPPGMTWEKYLYFLLKTLPRNIRDNYLQKLSVSINFWRKKGGCLSDETILKLEALGIPIIVGEHTNYKTTKKPVRMEYLDDIDIPEFKELPTFKRMCICILKNDHTCKYMGFSLNKVEKELKEQVMEKYKALI
ncbi:MAG TPA: DUF3440 domain-containing protein [Candidatus Barnesiella excrementigallinarum]|nr:DUF3440 domain-containing protein [Candidatus Barnesiella excrementigallinarum]